MCSVRADVIEREKDASVKPCASVSAPWIDAAPLQAGAARSPGASLLMSKLSMPSSSLSILVIDGNREERDRYIHRLETASSDYVIYAASTGHGGLEVYRSHVIDCVVLELELPDMSGFGVLVKLVPLAQHPEIPVIILTRLNFVSLMQLALLNGAHLCLYKSMSPDDLLNTAILEATSAVRRGRNGRALALPSWERQAAA
jgi:CheY-like chemotaxis protein